VSTSSNSEFALSIKLVGGLLVAVALIYLFIYSMAEDGYGKNMERVNQQDDGTLLARIKPVVTLDDITGSNDKELAVVETTAAMKSPKELYDGACLACHNTGVAGAPKLADAEAWGARAAAGVDALLASAKAGKGAMPPNGGSAYNDAEMKSIIEMMLAESGLMDAAPAAVESEPAPAAEPEIQVMEEVVEEPVKAVSVGGSSHDLAAGEAAYKTACFACHDFGVAGAPKLGDVAAWSARIPTGFDALLNTALTGKGAMPAKGGATQLSDAEVANIVAFMMEKVK